MKTISLEYCNLYDFLDKDKFINSCDKKDKMFKKIMESYKNDINNELGWMDLEKLSMESLIHSIETKANEIKDNADIFVVIGIGGSINGARAALEALKKEDTPEIIYLGNNLSSEYIKNILSKLKGKSLYANVIAKNFDTIEPGIGFRIIRTFLNESYGEEEAKTRIICTGTQGQRLEMLAKENGFTYFQFPENIGGRFSVLSPVGLLPMAVGGISLRELFNGAKNMRNHLNEKSSHNNPALAYGLARNILLDMGKNIEILSSFNPKLDGLGRWWEQLFAESEGQDNKGIFPTYCSFSEELHSYGQYIQNGQRILFETFINIEQNSEDFNLPSDNIEDGFEYIENKSIDWINKTAFEATLKAHNTGGVPSIIINIPKVNSYYFGQLFYFFEMACYVSGTILGVDLFKQPGVEDYKENMFKALKQ